MSGIALLIITIFVLFVGYIFYGRYIARKWGVDSNAKTPACEFEDGNDYIPTDRKIVFGHQFASIAGAGPIIGPITAAIFGWLPALLWILIGGIFFGAVHDFAAMYISVKNKGKTLGYVIELYIGKTGKKLFLAFSWLFSVLVIASFADLVANTFNGVGADSLKNLAGGQVATTSIMFAVFAICFGLMMKFLKIPSKFYTIIAILFLVVSIIIGVNMPIYMSTGTWHIIVFIYVAIATVVPVWILLQPRDYLNSYLLIAMILAAVIGIFVANPSIKLETCTGFEFNNYPMFPYMFVTIACGAISGLHALVSSGTASKQIKNEKDMLPVSYGAMLLESLLAVIAIIAVGTCYHASEIGDAGTPTAIFANSIASFLEKLSIPSSLSYSLITLAISAFALTSLDSVARYGRIAWQEFFANTEEDEKGQSFFSKIITNKFLATAVTLGFSYLLTKVGYATIWSLFGASNQLLASLTLIAGAVYFKKTKRQGVYLWIPMVIMFAVTISSLGITIIKNVSLLNSGNNESMYNVILQLVVAVMIFILGLFAAYCGFTKLLKVVDEYDASKITKEKTK